MLEEQPECRDDAFARTAYNICRWHHERYDGGGYPDGLQGSRSPSKHRWWAWRTCTSGW